MKRILIVTEYNLTSLGGIQKVISDITTRLHKKYIFDAVVFEKMDESQKNRFTQFNEIFCIPCNISSRKGIGRLKECILRPLRIKSALSKIIKKNYYDVIHCHDVLKGGYALEIAYKNDIKIRICQAHNPRVTYHSNILKNCYYNHMKRKIKYSNVKIGVSELAARSIFNNQKYIVIRNGIDLDNFNLGNFVSKKKNDYINFIHVGRFTFQKNHTFLLEVFSLIHNRIKHTSLKLVGWGEDESKIRQYIGDNKLDDCVTLLAGDSDVPKLMSSADYMIFPSRYEGLGIVLLEAQAMNIMCFASDVITSEIKDIGLCEMLPLSLGAAAWANYIIDFINNSKRNHYHLNKDVLNEFNINNVVKKYEDVYEFR